MAELERTYTIPLRKGWLAAPTYRRAKRAMHELQDFVKKHMKVATVLVGPQLNMKIWEHGIRNPPHHVKVTAVKNNEGVCRVELFGYKFEEVKKEKTEKKAGKGAKELAAKLKEKLTEKEEMGVGKKEEKKSASENEKKTSAKKDE